jgi:hypothetical protein
MTQLEASICTLFTWKDIQQEIQAQVRRQCPQCQLCKGKPKDYGHLPAKQAEKSEPWNRVDVDCVGPLPVKTHEGKTIYLWALTMIDPATGWFKVKSLDKEPDSDIVSTAMDDTWFCRYPRPQIIGYGNGAVQLSSNQLVFGRDMVLPMRFKATTNWEIIQARHQKEINS